MKQKSPFTMSIRKYRSIILCLCVFMFYSATTFAQVNIRGTVTDNNSEPLIGVNVIVKESRQGTITNVDGEFNLTVPNLNAELEFTYVGFQPQTVALNGKSLIKVVMAEDAELLEEIVVVGYGTQKKVSVTGSVAQISSRDITNAPAGNISSLLAGKLPGLTAKQSTGQPGADGSAIRVRGISTLGDGSATIIVDGVQRGFANIDPNDIDKISILKDASSAAVYGVQGAGGVILVTTKRGLIQRPKITYSGKISYNQNTQFPKFLNGPDYIRWYNRALEMDGIEPIFTQELYNKSLNGDPEGKVSDTNWFNEIMKPGAYSSNHNINVSGGNERTKYFLSMGYLSQDGIIDNFDYKRYNVRSNIDVNLNHGFRLELDLAARQEKRNAGFFSTGNQEWNNPITLASKIFPFLPTSYDGLPTVGHFSKAITFNPVVYNNTIIAKTLIKRIAGLTSNNKGISNCRATFPHPSYGPGIYYG